MRVERVTAVSLERLWRIAGLRAAGLLATYHLLLTTHYSLLIRLATCYLLLTTYCSLVTLITHYVSQGHGSMAACATVCTPMRCGPPLWTAHGGTVAA